jgi:hypothetical protein
VFAEKTFIEVRGWIRRFLNVGVVMTVRDRLGRKKR